MADIPRIGLDEIVLHFEALQDPRACVNLQHPLVSVVVIALMAILAGANGPHRHRQVGGAEIAIPPRGTAVAQRHPPARKDVVRRVLMTLKPGAFEACFADWLRSLRTKAATAAGVTQPVLPVDGKTARRSHDRQRGLGALHTVSLWASEFGLSLGQVACAEKSNEITAIPKLLRLVDITGAIITIEQSRGGGEAVRPRGPQPLAY